MRIPEQYYSVKSNILFCIAVPLFMMLFMVIYQPRFFGNEPILRAEWEENDGFCLPIVCAITLGVLTLSRAILCYALVRHNLSRREWILWQATEWVVACLFADLFLSLFFHMGYFTLLPRILLTGFGLVVIPYVIYWLAIEYTDRDNRLRQAEELIQDLRKGVERNETGMVRFADDKGNVKLVVGAERVISLESAGNYVTILYDDDGKLVRYSLRNTLKAMETLAGSSGLVRCHRSFFVNLSHVRTLRRTPQGLYAEIGHPGVDDIPVSKSYTSDLLHLFGN
ncbi:MAG: LytTR family transcriptional regulator [Bacteroidales bacterium]|nr:LytTR family transcriptional regulator [Bacteroidales bacterium]